MSLLAYKTDDIINFFIQKQAKIWYKSGLLSVSQFENLQLSYVHRLQTNNIYIRILMFVLTTFAASFSASMLSIFVISLFENMPIMIVISISVIICVVSFVLLNIFINQEHKFRTGIDEALLYISISGFGVALGTILTELKLAETDAILLFIIISTPILIFASIRFVDRLCSTLAYLGLCFAFFIVHVEYLPFGTMYLPFSSMLLASLSCYYVKKFKNHNRLFIWKNHLLIIEILSLILFYLSGNYFVVRNLSESLLHTEIKNGGDISLSYFFYAFTFFIPSVYLYFAIKKRDVILLRTAMLIVAFAVFTFKYYFSIASIEVSMTIGGVVLLGLAVYLFKLLKNNPQGFTSKQVLKDDNFESIVEKISILQTFGNDNNPSNSHSTDSGGEFGGAGAESKF